MTLLWTWSLYKPAVYLGLTIRLLMNTFILHSLLKTRLQTMFASKVFTLTNLGLSSMICHTAHSAWALLPGFFPGSETFAQHRDPIMLSFVFKDAEALLCGVSDKDFAEHKGNEQRYFCVLWFTGQLIKNHIILLFRCGSLFVWGELLHNGQQLVFEHLLEERIK